MVMKISNYLLVGVVIFLVIVSFQQRHRIAILEDEVNRVANISENALYTARDAQSSADDATSQAVEAYDIADEAYEKADDAYDRVDSACWILRGDC